MTALLHSLAQLLMLISIHDVLSGSAWITFTHYHMCAVRGSSVVMPCSFILPAGETATKVFWTIEPKRRKSPDLYENPSYTGRVEYYWHKIKNRKNCTLKLTDVKMTDSTGYNLDIITDKEIWFSQSAVELSITDLTVLVTGPVVEGREVKLSCRRTCSLKAITTVIWRKNGKYLPVEETNNYELHLHKIRIEDEGDYSCALKGHEGHPSTAVKLHVKFSPKNTSVSVRPDVITNGRSVNLTCNSDANPPVEIYTWFKVGESTPVGSGQQYSITDISSEDGGEYYCEARNKYGAEDSTAVSIMEDESVPGAQIPVLTVLTVLTVSVCGLLGLFCGVFWLSKKCKKEMLARGRNDQDVGDSVGNTQRENPNIVQMSSAGQILNPNTIQPDAVYQNLNPNTTQPDAVYQSLDPNTIKPDAVYQSLNPNTTQPDAVYQSLDPNTIQSDAVYQRLNPNTTQPDAVYQSLDPNTTQPDAVYQTLNPNIIQPDAVYQSLDPNTIQPDAVYQSLNPNTT